MANTNKTRCGECNHKDHDAGRCNQCNCGESERIGGDYGTADYTGYNADLSESISHIYRNGGEVRGERKYWFERKKY